MALTKQATLCGSIIVTFILIHGYYITYLNNSHCDIKEPFEYPLEISHDIHIDDDIDTEINENINNFNKRKYPGIPSVISIGPEKCATTSFAELLGEFDEFILPSTSPIDVKLELRMWLDPQCLGYNPMNLTKAYFAI